MTKKTKFRGPFVGEGGPFASEDLPAIPIHFKTLHEHVCSVCEQPFAPFGVDYPDATKWFCRKHIGGYMPEVQVSLDRQRWDAIRHDAMLIANLWLSVAIAAERGDRPSAFTACENIRKLNTKIFPLVKEVGTEARAP